LAAVLGAGVALKLTLLTVGPGVTLLVSLSPEQALKAVMTAMVNKDVLNMCIGYLQTKQYPHFKASMCSFYETNMTYL
jgi:hypothetical protein